MKKRMMEKGGNGRREKMKRKERIYEGRREEWKEGRNKRREEGINDGKMKGREEFRRIKIRKEIRKEGEKEEAQNLAECRCQVQMSSESREGRN